MSNWPHLKDFFTGKNLLFIPAVSPGYVDTRIRPWNAKNTKERENGVYYEKMFSAAIKLKVPIINITSYNEIHEGTQIEPCVPMTVEAENEPKYSYLDYTPNQPNFYLEMTKRLVCHFKESK